MIVRSESRLLVPLLLGAVGGGLTAQQTSWIWRQLAPSNAPSARRSAGIAFDSQRGRAVLFGGTDAIKLGGTWEWDGTNWSQRSAAGPVARAYHSMVYDSQRRRTVLFGGNSAAGLLGDTWEWDGSVWTSIAVAGPGPRCGPVMTYDSLRGRALLFGGQGSGPAYADTWEYDGVSWSQVSTSGPTARFYGGLAYDPPRDRTVLFGGQNGVGTLFGDTWEWDGATWSQVATNGPSPRFHHSLVYDVHRQRSVLFGGQTNGPFVSETWLWDGVAWAQVNVSGPAARSDQSMVYDSVHGQALLFGGIGPNYLSDTWVLANGFSAPMDVAPVPTSNAPPAMSGHAIAPVPAGGVLLFGGDTGTAYPILTFELHSGTWTQQFSILNPMVRAGHSLVLDPIRSNDVLFGGENPAGTALSDTWTWSGAANGGWRYHPLLIAPSARSAHRMTFDRGAGVALLFGGKDQNANPLGDFWSWDGGTWTQLTASAGPSARFAHGLAFDQYRSRTVLYGGADANGARDDVWEWNGSQWVQVTPAAAPTGPWTPGPREGFAMAYDRRSERIVVHGGSNGVCLNDTWAWDGTYWTSMTPTSAPPSARQGHQLVFDPALNELTLFAGGCDGLPMNDYWRLDLPVFWRSGAYGQGCPGSNGTPHIAVATGSSAIIGQTLRMTISNVPSFGLFASVYGILGLSRTMFLGQPIPFDLGIYLLPGCSAWTSSDLSFAATLPVGGVSTWDLALPNNAGLLGIEFNLQALCFESPVFPRWATVSDALFVRCGNQ